MSQPTAKPRLLNTGMMTRIGLMGAISIVLGFFPEIPMAFFAPWLKLDFAYVPVLLTGFALGFWPGFIVLALKNLFQLLTTNSAGVGQLADMLIGTAMLLPAVLVYGRMRTRKGALLGILAGILAMAVVGVLANRFIMLPVFLGAGFTAFMEKNPYILWIGVLPFNLIKGAAVGLITFLLYKYLAPFLKRGLKA